MKRGERTRGLTLEARLVASMEIGSPRDCWLWLRGVDNHGYGRLWFRGRMHLVSRVVCAAAHGEPFEGAQALHSCDVRRCNNPAHLRWGTISENVGDMVLRGRNRSPCGRDNVRAKLTDASAMAVYCAVGDQQGIAERFGVSQMTVSRVKRKLSWKHIHNPK